MGLFNWFTGKSPTIPVNKPPIQETKVIMEAQYVDIQDLQRETNYGGADYECVYYSQYCKNSVRISQNYWPKFLLREPVAVGLVEPSSRQANWEGAEVVVYQRTANGWVREFSIPFSGPAAQVASKEE